MAEFNRLRVVTKTRVASAEIVKAVESGVLNKIAYRGILFGWSLVFTERFDSRLAAEYRRRNQEYEVVP